ncbi:ras-GEF domain-containing family member 1B [Vespula squamosa]|uniref:Ras-GEF domain-containing family member 1B n=1 Tax=Vespula squamosa TaxID=30214 RepID=A0ABD2ACF1_VESSQ
MNKLCSGLIRAPPCCTIIGVPISDNNKSLPQTPAGGVGGKGGGGSGVPGSGMVNGAGADHQDIRDGAAINTEHAASTECTRLPGLCTEEELAVKRKEREERG